MKFLVDFLFKEDMFLNHEKLIILDCFEPDQNHYFNYHKAIKQTQIICANLF